VANITVSADSNLDDVANQNLLNGENITINGGATLTVDSDNRWAQQAAVVGSAAVSISSQGGRFKLDGTKTWWLPFDGSSGQHGLALTSAQYYDAPAYTNQTTESNNATANDMTLLPAAPAVNDAYYFGHDYQFTRLWINIGTAGAGTWTIIWEYWNGSAWTALSNVRDDSSGFKPSSTGWKMVQFSIPTNWATYAVNGVTTYWIRARVSAYTSITVRPLGTQARISELGMTLSGPGGASGEIIGIWDTAGGVPVQANSSSATGWFKLRSKSGTFVDNEALSINGIAYNGALVNSTTGGQRGWIHFVGEKSENVIYPYLGEFQVRGDWFYVGQTDGLRRQTLQLPVSDYFPGVWIETAASSGVYTFWPNGIGVWTAATMPTDLRGKFVEVTSTGLLRIGGTSGGADCGYLPPSGCNIRIPNVIVGTSSSANWDANYWDAAANEHWEVRTTGGGVFDIEYMCGLSVYVYGNQATSMNISHSCFSFALVANECHESSILDDVHVSHPINGTTGYDISSGSFSSILLLEIKNCSFWRYTGLGATSSQVYTLNIVIQTGGVVTVSDTVSGMMSFRTAGGTTYPIYISGAGELYVSRCTTIGGGHYLNASKFRAVDLVYADRLFGATDSSFPATGFYISGSIDGVLDGVSFFSGISDIVAPYNYLIATLGCKGVRARNFGTQLVPLDLGNKTFYSMIGSASGFDKSVKTQRIYLSNSRSTTYLYTQPTSSGYVIENCSQNNAATVVNGMSASTNGGMVLYKGFYGGGASTGGFGASGPIQIVLNGVFGTHFWDAFHSATRGKIGLFFTPKTSEYPSNIAYEITGGAPAFSLSGTLYNIAVGDTIVYTWPHYILGYTGFTSDAVQINGTNVSGGTYGFGNHRIRYCLDKNDGNGFGSWQECTAVNLSAETGISPTLGFKMKFEISCVSADVTNAINGFYVFGATDAVSQLEQYPITETVRVTLVGIAPGSSYILRDIGGNVLAEKYHSAVANEEVILEVPSDSTSTEVYISAEIRKGSGTPNYEPFETAGYVSFLTPLRLTILQRLDVANP
jgi:hypothetical protein